MTAREMIVACMKLPLDCLDLPLAYEQQGVYRQVTPPFVVHVDANGRPTLEPTLFRYIDISGSNGTGETGNSHR